MPISPLPKVNLFILGAAKSGTTTLHTALQKHLDILMSTPKEPLFFEAEYENGYEYYARKYFVNWKGESIVGESRHRNLYLPYVPERIEAMSPDARFVVIVRHPVNRAYSHWWHWYSRGVEKRTFLEAVEENLLRIERGPIFVTKDEIDLYRKSLDLKTGYSTYPSYIDSGYYAEQIARYTRRFGADKVHIILFDDLVADPNTVLNRLFAFIGIPPLHNIEIEPQNKAMSPAGNNIIEILRRLYLKNIFSAGLRRRVHSVLMKIFASTAVVPSMDEELRSKLLDHYEPHNIKLETMIGRNLPSWRK